MFCLLIYSIHHRNHYVSILWGLSKAQEPSIAREPTFESFAARTGQATEYDSKERGYLAEKLAF